MSTDVIELPPGSMAMADMRADNPGTWLSYCRVADHIHAGKMALFTVEGPGALQPPGISLTAQHEEAGWEVTR